MRCPGALLCGLLLAASLAFAAENDVAGSRDPLGIERFPRAWIVDYVRDDELRAHEFAVHRLERLRGGDPERALLRFDATLESATYRIPDGVAVTEVADHYRSMLADGILYRCGSLECGRSNEWANQIFGKPILYGPDRNQQYLAWEGQDRLVAVYVIERGNKRVYAHVQVLDPVDDAVTGANALLARRLAGQGWTAIDGIVPGADGQLPATAPAVFAAVGPLLAEFAGLELRLVCHLYDAAQPTDDLVAASGRCAEAAVAMLMKAGVPAGVKVVAAGVGPLAPRRASPVARLELVVPRWLGGGAASPP